MGFELFHGLLKELHGIGSLQQALHGAAQVVARLAAGPAVGPLLLVEWLLGNQALLGAGATVGADRGFPHLAVDVAQVGEVDQLVHQRKAPGGGLVDLGGRLTA